MHLDRRPIVAVKSNYPKNLSVSYRAKTRDVFSGNKPYALAQPISQDLLVTTVYRHLGPDCNLLTPKELLTQKQQPSSMMHRLPYLQPGPTP